MTRARSPEQPATLFVGLRRMSEMNGVLSGRLEQQQTHPLEVPAYGAVGHAEALGNLFVAEGGKISHFHDTDEAWVDLREFAQ